MIYRRKFIAGGLALTTGAAAFPGSSVSAQSGPAQSAATLVSDKIAQALASSRHSLLFDGTNFSGPAFDWLKRRGAESGAFLLGEEHGIAENPKLAAELFKALVSSGYSRLAIEVSPPIGEALETVFMKDGREAFHRFLRADESRAAFFGMREEAAFFEAARLSLPEGKAVWGLDYEVAADRYLIAQLVQMRKPAAAKAALAALGNAARSSWSQYETTRNPQFIFSFSGDPKLVQALRSAWPKADLNARLIMETLEQTLRINALWVAGKGYESNLLRSQWLRTNLLRYWQQRSFDARREKIFFKFGASHMSRGLSVTDMFDIGSLVPELVATQGSKSFHLLVLPGAGRQTASLDPASFRYVPGNRNQYGEAAAPFHTAVLEQGFTLFDTSVLRPLVKSSSSGLHPDFVRTVHGFDAVLVMTGSQPSTNL
jgi:hypothetical protein